MSIPHNNQGLPPACSPPPNNNGPHPVVRPNGPAPHLMKELCQPSIHERSRPIASIPIQDMDFGFRHHIIQQVQNTCKFHGLQGDDANRHIEIFLGITQRMKQNGVSDDALRLSLFPYSLKHHATTWNEITKFRQDPNESLFEAWERYKLSIDRRPNHNMLLVTQIVTFYNGWTLRHRDTINAAVGGTFMQKTPKDCYELIENMTAHHNHWDTSATRDETFRNISFSTTTESPEVVRQLEMMNKNFLDMMRQIQSIKYLNTKCETCGGPYSFIECPAVGGYTQEAAYATTGNHNFGANSRGDLKAITTRSGVVYNGPTIPPTPPPIPKDVERETNVRKDKVQATSSESTTNVQPLVVQDPILEPEVAPKPNTKPSIAYPLRLNVDLVSNRSLISLQKLLVILDKSKTTMIETLINI
nr:hypothetical protein [Tanacetum cinerariifolium]